MTELEYKEPRTMFYIGGRRSGKTARLIAWLVDNPKGIVVTHNVDAAKAMMAQSKKMGFELGEERIVSYQQVKNGVLRGRNCEVGIDNLELLLSEFAGTKVSRITATGGLLQ